MMSPLCSVMTATCMRNPVSPASPPHTFPQGTDHDLLVPLASNSVMVHNEHHTMSMLVVFLQVCKITMY